jgi:hypothetical protein
LSWNRRFAAIKAQGLIGKENRPESDEAQRQIDRERVELLCTRVGMAGQFIKLKALDQYEKLGSAGMPDHLAGLQKQLAGTLDELAAMMADVPELTAVIDCVSGSTASSPADDYLPSRQSINELRTLAKESLRLRERLNRLPEEVLSRIQDSEAAGKQKARTDVLIEKTNELVESLRQTVQENGPGDPVSKVLNDSGKILTHAAKLLLEAKEKATSGQRFEAEKCRVEAQTSLRNEASKLAKAYPATPIAPAKHAVETTVEALHRAEAAMRRAGELLEKNPDLLLVEKSMRLALDALEIAVGTRLRSLE